jgi:uncharacterized protein YjbI with pentapeptide repeats
MSRVNVGDHVTASPKTALEMGLRLGADFAHANFAGADLRGANLRGARFRGVDLARADLRGATLRDADCTNARLPGATLCGADCTNTDFTGATLRGALVTDATLTGATLRGADVTDVTLAAAALTPIRDDLWAVLSAMPAEVPGLRHALLEGRIDGGVYHGSCACLIGTLAQVRGCSAYDLDLLIALDSTRPSERWFHALCPGDTPTTSAIARITLAWIDTWLANMRAAFASVATEGV